MTRRLFFSLLAAVGFVRQTNAATIADPSVIAALLLRSNS